VVSVVIIGEKQMSKILKGSLVLLALLTPAYSDAYPYRGTADIEFVSSGTHVISTSEHSIRYSLYHQDQTYADSQTFSATFINSVLQKSIAEYVTFLRSRDVRIIECRPSLELEIYHVSSGVLNDHGRFNQWGSSAGVGDLATFNLFGLYDGIPHEPAESAIFLTDRGARNNEILIAHEVSHYLFDKFCLNLRYNGKSEMFAREFQSFYSSRN
jgi:hypothetical protein